MKTYPSINTTVVKGLTYYVFDKLDGSNIRAEWTRKNGFHKFGTRNQLLGEGNPLFPATYLIKDQYEEALSKIFTKARYEKVICFFEYVGPNSFAGSHPDPEELMDVFLFDINPYKKGILPPKEYLKLVEDHVEIIPLIEITNINDDLIREVREGTLAGMTFEGVVGKGMNKNQLTMVKIKSRNWLDKLRGICQDETEFNKRAY